MTSLLRNSCLLAGLDTGLVYEATGDEHGVVTFHHLRVGQAVACSAIRSDYQRVSFHAAASPFSIARTGARTEYTTGCVSRIAPSIPSALTENILWEYKRKPPRRCRGGRGPMKAVAAEIGTKRGRADIRLSVVWVKFQRPFCFLSRLEFIVPRCLACCWVTLGGPVP